MRAPLKATAVAMISASLLVGGCTTVNPYTREQQTSKASIGAGVGAVAGAVVGIATGDNAKERRKRALIGAGIGALSGSGVGYYMDVQEAKLRQQLEGTGVSVTRHGDNITLNMPGAITFGFDRDEVQPQFYPVLNNLAQTLREYDQTIIEVAGHTDNVGTAAYNQGLSERRAQSVANYLAGQGINQQRMIVVGAGLTRPVADNSTEAGRAQNRRVEITLVPIQS